MTLLDDIEQSLIAAHIQEPSYFSLYTRDFSTLVFRAMKEQSPEADNACLAGMTTAMAWMLATHITEEPFLAEFNKIIRDKVAEVRAIYAQAEKELTSPTNQ